MTFNEWIKTKGVEKMAATLGISQNTIYSWVHRGSVPRNVWPAIVLAYAELGIRDLVAMEDASKVEK